MLYLIQVYRMVANKALFISLFNDLSYEINDMGYEFLDDQMELVNELLDNHFGLALECDRQLRMLTESIIKYQGKLNMLNEL